MGELQFSSIEGSGVFGPFFGGKEPVMHTSGTLPEFSHLVRCHDRGRSLGPAASPGPGLSLISFSP